MCEKEKYCTPGVEKQLPIQINTTLLEMLDEFDEMLPVTCDQWPSSLVNWYNKKTKAIVSNEQYFSSPL
jgi:hypothetical protein